MDALLCMRFSGLFTASLVKQCCCLVRSAMAWMLVALGMLLAIRPRANQSLRHGTVSFCTWCLQFDAMKSVLIPWFTAVFWAAGVGY